MLLGSNTFDWLMCPLHVSVISALCLGTSLTSPAWGQVTGACRAEAGFAIPGWATWAQQRCRALFAGLGYEGIEHSPLPNVRFTRPS